MKKRIFVAVDISDEARQKVAGYIGELKEKFPRYKSRLGSSRKTASDVKIFGRCGQTSIGKIKGNCEEIAGQFSNLKFQISNTGVFPSPRNARVLWLGVNGDVEELQKINSVLEVECEKIGFKKEKRIFKPHLTIARIREPQKSKKLVQKHLENKFEPVSFEVCEIVIYESKLQPTGSVYEKVSSFKFKVQSSNET